MVSFGKHNFYITFRINSKQHLGITKVTSPKLLIGWNSGVRVLKKDSEFLIIKFQSHSRYVVFDVKYIGL